MTLDDPGVRDRRVAVGISREAAAAAVGRDHDDVFLTTYSDLTDEVDLDAVATLDLVPGAGFAEALDGAWRRFRDHGAPAVRVAVRPGVAMSLCEDLRRAGVTIADVQALPGGTALLTLATRHPGEPGHDRLVLAALDVAAKEAVAEPASLNPPPAAVSPVLPANPAERQHRPDPYLLGVLGEVQRWQVGPRRRLLVLTSLVVLVLVLLALGVFAESQRPLLHVALPLLVVLVLVGAALACYVVLLLSRQVHMQTGRIERLLIRNREVVRERSTALSRRLQKVEDAQQRLPFLEEYVQTLAETSAVTSAQVRELADLLRSREVPARSEAASADPGLRD